MKYDTGIKDKYHNTKYDFVKVCKDMKRVVLGKLKFTKALYEVMSMRFTIAHYDMHGWLCTYNGNWAELARQISPWKATTGDLTISGEETLALEDLASFLYAHDKDEIPE